MTVTEKEEARFRADPGVCPGYGRAKSCGRPAEYFQRLGNDPTAYCRRHALRAAAFWDSLGFPSPQYVRLSDGAVFVAGWSAARGSRRKRRSNE
jgi:hypothetical protein